MDGEGAGEPAAAPAVVLFDFDGVLVHGDTFRGFVSERYARAPWRKVLVLLALPWLLLQWPFSRWRALRTLVHIALLGLDERRYRATSERFADELARRPRQFIRDGLLALRRHQQAGDRVIVVTACEQALAERVLAQLGLDGLEILGSQLRPGWFGLRAQHNFGRRKVQRLAAHGVTSWQRAYSDSPTDAPMLAPAAEPVLVNATPKQCRQVEKALGRATARVAWS